MKLKRLWPVGASRLVLPSSFSLCPGFMDGSAPMIERWSRLLRWPLRLSGRIWNLIRRRLACDKTTPPYIAWTSDSPRPSPHDLLLSGRLTQRDYLCSLFVGRRVANVKVFESGLAWIIEFDSGEPICMEVEVASDGSGKIAAFDITQVSWKNVRGLAPATGRATPIQVEVCSHPPTSTRGW